jgi:hypothetical protein
MALQAQSVDAKTATQIQAEGADGEETGLISLPYFPAHRAGKKAMSRAILVTSASP